MKTLFIELLFTGLLAVTTIFSFVFLGMRAFYFFDPTRIIENLGYELVRWFRFATPKGFQRHNHSFQAHYQKQAENVLLTYHNIMTMAVNDLKVLAEEIEVKAAPIDKAQQQGYQEAKDRYMITHPCSVCGEPIPITSPRAKEAASRYMTEHGWAHASCHEKRRQS